MKNGFLAVRAAKEAIIRGLSMPCGKRKKSNVEA